ncbi:MAG: hypothetical protein C5S40_00560 [ANME-2 cluster archaeon]|nr:hypothetical protein [ANME-2 cluster archaeon]
MRLHRQDSNIVYAGTLSRGVYVSPNQGKNWLNLGTPEYDVFAISTASLYTATEGELMQCTGTGLITGRVTNTISKADIHSATVFNDLGIKTISVNGKYMMVSPSGICGRSLPLAFCVRYSILNQRAKEAERLSLISATFLCCTHWWLVRS